MVASRVMVAVVLAVAVAGFAAPVVAQPPIPALYSGFSKNAGSALTKVWLEVQYCARAKLCRRPLSC